MWLDKTKKYDKRLSNIRKGSWARLTAEVTRGTPVDKGNLRASWTPSLGVKVKINNVETAGFNVRSNDPTGVINSSKNGDTYNLANGQPYARVIEYEGHSPQAPGGMMRIAAAKWPQIVKAETVKWKNT